MSQYDIFLWYGDTPVTTILMYLDLSDEDLHNPHYTPPAYLPTQEEIRDCCLQIQSKWTDEEREGRRVLLPTELYSAPYYKNQVSIPESPSTLWAPI